MKDLQLSALVDTMDYLDTDTCVLADPTATATEVVEEVEEELGEEVEVEVEEEGGCTGECEVEVGGGLVGRILSLLAGRR